MKFKCRKCGHNRLEEVMTNVTQSTEIVGVDEDDLLIYGNATTDGGELDRFQCGKCGAVIKGVSSMDGLVAWLKEEGMA